MAITISRATANGAFYIIGSTDDTNTVYGKSSYSETFIFLGKSYNPWYGTNDLSGTFTIADVSDGDAVSIGSWDSPKAFNLSIKSSGNNIILTQTASTDAQHWNPSLNSGVGDYEDYSGTGIYNLNALADGETVTVKLGFLVDAPRMTNVIQISGVGDNLYYNYVENDTALVTETDTGTAFTYGGYEYGQHLISSTADYIGLFNNSDNPIGESRFYVDVDTATKALTFFEDDTTSTISVTLNQVYDSVTDGLVDDGTVTFTQNDINAFVKTVTAADSIDTFTPVSGDTTADATTYVTLSDITSVAVPEDQGLDTDFITLLNPTTVVSIVGASGNDTITGSAVADILDGGDGDDIYVMFATGQTATAPTSWTANTSGSTVSTTDMDIITTTAGDELDFSLIAPTLASATTTKTLITTAATFAASGTVATAFKGTYSATAETFTSNASGTDSLLVYDNDGAGTGTTVEALVLVGATSITVSSGIFTTA